MIKKFKRGGGMIFSAKYTPLKCCCLGVLFIRVLKELETLKLSNLPEVKNPEHVLRNIQNY